MMFQSDNYWKPRLAFLRSGRLQITCDGLSNTEELSWKFYNMRTPHIPLRVSRCKMTGFGFTAVGVGDGILETKAMTIAFAEAWERLWLQNYVNHIKNGVSISSSNGCAAGKDDKSALHAAESELKERAMVLAAWHSEAGWNPHKASGIVARLWKAILNKDGWKLRFFKIKAQGFGNCLALFAFHSDKGILFSSAFAKSKEVYRKAESKIVRSVLRNAFSNCVDSRSETDWKLPQAGTPEDHLRYYLDASKVKCFKFLDRQCTNQIIKMGNLNKVKTKIIFSANGSLPAVAYSYNNDWPTLNWGVQSIQGENPWPHPLS